MSILRISLPIVFIFFLILSIIERKFQNQKDIIKTSYNGIIIIYLMYILWHSLVFSKEVYLFDISINNINLGFTGSYFYTKLFSIVGILLSIGLYLMHSNSTMQKFFLFLIGIVINVNFVTNNTGIVLCLALHSIIYTIIYCKIAKRKKLINNHLISISLTYLLISYGFMYINTYNILSIFAIILGVSFQFGMIPYSRKLTYLFSETKDKNIAYLMSLNIIFYFSLLQFALINHNALEMGLIISIIMIIYGGIGLIKNSSIYESMSYLYIISFGMNLILLINDKYNLSQISIASSAMFFYIIFLILSKLPNDIHHIKSDYFVHSFLMILILSLTIFPILSPYFAKYYIIINSNIIDMIFYLTGNIFITIYALKNLFAYDIQFDRLKKIDFFNSFFIIILAFFYFISLIGTVNIQIINHFFNFINIKDSVSFSSFISATLGSILIILMIWTISKKDLHYNLPIDMNIWKTINSIIAIYDMMILYISNLIKITKIKSIDLFTNAKEHFINDKSHKIPSDVMIVVVLFFLFILKIFN